MTRMQGRRWLKWLATIARVLFVALPTAFALSVAGVIPMVFTMVFIAATIAGLAILTMVVVSLLPPIPASRVRQTWAPALPHGDPEMWRRPSLCSHDSDISFSRSAGNFDDWHRPSIESHMSIKVLDLNADGSLNFSGTGVCSSGTRDIEF